MSDDRPMAKSMERMTFKAYKDNGFEKELETVDPDGFKVMINPETFERTLGVKSEKESTARPGNSPGHDAGLDVERYSFDLIFDGTGVTGTTFESDDGLATLFRQFLDVVYAVRPAPDRKKEANFVAITYCGETFYTKLESMTIRYLLFHPSGHPLRIKASCRFSSVEKQLPEDKDKGRKRKSRKKSAPPVTPATPNNACICTCPTYGETVASANENDSISLMTSTRPYSEMEERNYTPAYGDE